MTDLLSRLAFDTERGEIRDEDRRYLLMRPDVLMGMLHGLDADTQRQVLASLMASTQRHGGASIRAYAIHAQGPTLMEGVARASASLGWGLWQIDQRGDGDDSTLVLRVTNSPFAAGHGACNHPVCAPIAGILAALATTVLGKPAEARELRCAAMPRQDGCDFVASVRKPRSPSSSDSNLNSNANPTGT